MGGPRPSRPWPGRRWTRASEPRRRRPAHLGPSAAPASPGRCLTPPARAVGPLRARRGAAPGSKLRPELHGQRARPPGGPPGPWAKPRWDWGPAWCPPPRAPGPLEARAWPRRSACPLAGRDWDLTLLAPLTAGKLRPALRAGGGGPGGPLLAAPPPGWPGPRARSPPGRGPGRGRAPPGRFSRQRPCRGGNPAARPGPRPPPAAGLRARPPPPVPRRSLPRLARGRLRPRPDPRAPARPGPGARGPAAHMGLRMARPPPRVGGASRWPRPLGPPPSRGAAGPSPRACAPAPGGPAACWVRMRAVGVPPGWTRTRGSRARAVETRGRAGSSGCTARPPRASEGGRKRCSRFSHFTAKCASAEPPRAAWGRLRGAVVAGALRGERPPAPCGGARLSARLT